jgi:hypothetical protein
MGDITLSVITLAAQYASFLMLELADSPNNKRKESTEEGARRSQRRRFHYDHALETIGRNYLGLPRTHPCLYSSKTSSL